MSSTYPFIQSYPGWSPWQPTVYAHTGTTAHHEIMPFSKLPNSILPANKIWGQGYSGTVSTPTIVGGLGTYTL